MSRPPASRANRTREGMALLMVLLLVGAMAAIAVVVLDDVRFSTRRAANTESGATAQWYAISAERLARRQIRRLNDANPARTPVEPDWNGATYSFPIDNGLVQATLTDGQSCFNLNSVVRGVAGALTAHEEGVEQLARLAMTLGIAEPQARTIANSLADWIDSDSIPRPFGAEDSAYAASNPALLTAGVLLVEPSELRAVRGVDASAYSTLRPFLCALPEAAPSPLNLNTLAPQDAPLIAMLGPDIDARAVEAALAARPASGWQTPEAFWSRGALAGARLSDEARGQTTLRTRYFDFRVQARYADGEAVRTGLFEIAKDNRIRTVVSRWTEAD